MINITAGPHAGKSGEIVEHPSAMVLRGLRCAVLTDTGLVFVDPNDTEPA